MGNGSSHDEVPTRSITNTPTFLETCVLDADYKALKEHLVNNQVQQSDLDRCLLRGLQIVQRKERELSDVAQALTVLLQSGAKWNKHTLLADHKTPLHIICESPRDHHELLDLMIKSSQRIIINTQDIDACTALLYAVRNENANCVKCLIANGADVDIGYDTYTSKTRFLNSMKLLNPIMEAIRLLSFCSGNSSNVIMSKIFDLLFDAAVEKNKGHFRSCKTYIVCAVTFRNVHSAKKLIKIGAPLDAITCENYYVWELVARMGNVELLKCLFSRGIDKNSTHHKHSILWQVCHIGNIEAVRYLLDIAVAIPTYTPKVRQRKCDKCKENILIMRFQNELNYYLDPCMRAIEADKVELVKLLDEYGSQCCKSFAALRWAVKSGSEGVISYLLNKYTYPLNIEYIIEVASECMFTLLTDPFIWITPGIIKLLLDYGADPAKPICSSTRDNTITAAATIYNRPLEVIAEYIRRSGTYKYGNVSLFRLSILQGCPYILVMFLISGYSRGVFSIQKFKVEHKPKLEKLMKEWNLYDNNVIPLKQRCRRVILNHMSPRADLKIKKLPLPPCLIKFLSIPELDSIVYKYSESVRD